MEGDARPALWKVLAAFGVIYFVWGSTFLAIRIGVQEIPPLLMAGLRFLAAGLCLYGWTRARGVPAPSRTEWASAAKLAAPIFLVNYGLVFWAEQRVPSGLTAVMMATIPAFMALFEIALLRTQKLTAGLAASLAVGFAGVAVLIGRVPGFEQEPMDTAGALALIVAAIGWSLGASLTRKLPLPKSKAMSSGAQMLAGGVFLLAASLAFGEPGGFDPRRVSGAAWASLVYLIVAGSILAFTAYTWLIHHVSPTKVGTYAYVNPVVAVALGYYLGGEVVGERVLLGTALVLASVVVISRLPAEKRT